MARRMRHRQTKGPETAGPDLNYCATSRLYDRPPLVNRALDASGGEDVRKLVYVLMALSSARPRIVCMARESPIRSDPLLKRD